MPNYDFSQLSPIDFENLVHGLLEKEWSCRLEAFKSGRDQGIDLRYSCPPLGSTIIQCKHYVSSGIRKLLRDLKKDEAPKKISNSHGSALATLRRESIIIHCRGTVTRMP
jgi:hypothetical protein